MPLVKAPVAAASGSVATDTIWDAAGDLALGSAADTAAKLSKGTPGQVLLPNATTLAWAGDSVYGLAPTGAISESFPRYLSSAALQGTTGTLRMVALWLPAGATITNILAVCNATAEAGGSHAFAALYDSSRALLRQSTDETGTGAVGASAAHTFALSSQFVTTYSGLHYVGMNVVASTMPGIICGPSSISAILAGVAPVLGGNTTDTGLTGTAPNPAAAITQATQMMYVYVT